MKSYRDYFSIGKLERDRNQFPYQEDDDYYYVDMDTFDSRKEVADSMIELGRTLGKENDWSELYFAGNKSVAARFCVDDRQLMKFLKGFYNSTDQEAVFDEKRCSVECLNKLAELGMDTRGKASIDSLSYTRLDTVFEQGQTLRNFNGHDYRVMEKLSKKNLLLMDTMTGSFVVESIYLQGIPVEQNPQRKTA